MRILGLTGGTGSGKTEAGRLFARHGIPIIDADAVGHELLAPGGAGFEAVTEAFGDRRRD
jgi:dephospho-CoA kinase